MRVRPADRAAESSSAPQVTLEELERRRWHLWLVAALLIVSVSVAVVILVGGDTVPSLLLPDSPGLRYGFLGVSTAFLLYVAEQERTFKRMTRTLFEQRDRTLALEARVEELTTLVRSARTVNSALTAEEVFEQLLRSAMDLTSASTGAVFLRVNQAVTVAVSAGPDAPARGRSLPLGEGPIGRVAVSGEPEVVGRHDGDGPPSPSGVSAPLVVQGRRVGVLAIERGPESPAFTDAEVSTVMLFAEHAATAVANANRYEAERRRVETLVDAAEKRAEFVATMVHDLRSPLVAVRGYAQLLRDRLDRLNPDQRAKAFESMLNQSAHLERMIDEILASSSVEAGKEVRREPVDLAALLGDACEVIRSVVGARGDEREIELHGGAQAGVIVGDPEAFRHVFTNLIENAVKYSPAGSPVSVGVERDDESVRVHVIDRGRGIPAEDLPLVFQRFRQSTGGSAGVGLGLYIVRTLVQAHAGRVSVKSEPGVGTMFTVTLPLTPELSTA